MTALARIEVNLEQHPLRHGNGRKCSEFEDAPSEIVRAADMASLERFKAEDLGIDNPFDDISSHMPLVFILEYNGDEYIVNTEGFEYCRYVMRVGGTH